MRQDGVTGDHARRAFVASRPRKYGKGRVLMSENYYSGGDHFMDPTPMPSPREFLSDFWRSFRLGIEKKSYVSGSTESEVVSQFHKLYYELKAQTWMNTTWLGVPLTKCPLDLWIYQEILHDVRPDVIIETGTFLGGSALFLATICQIENNGRVITIDIANRTDWPRHDRITYLHGSSISDAIVGTVNRLIQPNDKILVVLDSDHSMHNVLRELDTYAPMVTTGSYLIVEDTNINGHPVDSSSGPGPTEAIDEFLRKNDRFVRETEREKFLLTFNPGGFLKRVN